MTAFDFDRVAVDDVSRHFGRRRALSHVTFTGRAGDIVGLLGPNGAGKSTLLAILSTLLRPSDGRIRYGDRPPGPAVRARLGWLGHDLQLYPELTARENLRFFARLQSVADPDRRVSAALESSALEARADEPLSRLSRGMRQRLALERALLHEPRLVLLDEPFTGLDDTSAAALVARLRRLAAAGCIVLLATHDLDVVEGVLTRAIVLHAGRVAAAHEGSDAVRARYVETIAACSPPGSAA